MESIYLDNSATTQPSPEVILAVQKTMEHIYGNPSSLHKKGIAAERILNDCRERVAHILGAEIGEIYFTSGGTEGNNLAIKGLAAARGLEKKHLICSAVEHPSTIEAVRYLEKEGLKVTYLPVDEEGFVDGKLLKESLTKETMLVSIMHVNNEIGTVQPVKKIAEIIKENSRALFHCDMVQSFLRLPLTGEGPGPDLITISAHKIQGPKGVGVLYKKGGISLKPLFHGGGQEEGLRSGTENVPAIAGLSASLQKEFDSQRVQEMKDHLTQSIIDAFPWVKVNSPPKDSAPHILSLSFPGFKGEVLLHALEEEGVYVSTGSACHAKTVQISHVLEAIGLSREEAQGTLRFSLSEENTPGQIEMAGRKIVQAVKGLSSFAGGKR